MAKKQTPTNELIPAATSYPRFEMKKLAELAKAAHPDGVRRREADAVFRLGKSVAKLGLLRIPTFNARTGFLLDGDVLLAELRRAGTDPVPCWVVDLPEELEDLAHLALNNHVGEWEWQPVSDMLKAIAARQQDLGLTGFHESDTGPLAAADWTPAEKGPMDGSDPAQIGLL